MSRTEDRLGLAVECAGILLVGAAGLAIFHLWKQGIVNLVQVALVLAMPMTATAMFLLAVWLVPALLAVGRIRFPLNFTLPLTFASLLFAATHLFSTWTGSSLVATPEMVRTALFWGQPRALVLTAVIQFACLSLIAVLRAEPETQR